MKLLKSMASAFLMYSRIPMPQVEWKEENRRYALCFFPMIGAVIGTVFLLWRYACLRFEVGGFLCGAVSMLIPIIITGGIHLDGFCDVTDANSSYADKAKKLEIMSDPHIGSFAAMRLAMYLILQTALLCEIKAMSAALIIACGFVLSRALSGLAAVTFKGAKKDGTLQSFARPAQKKITVTVLLAFAIISCAAMIGIDVIMGACAVLGAAVSFAYYRYFSYKSFGGITGDTAGWFLQICEMSMLIFTVIGSKYAEVLAL